MKKIIFLFVFMCAVSYAQDEQILFNDANLSYQKRDYQKAEEHYSELINTYSHSKHIEEYYYYDYETLIKISEINSTGKNKPELPQKKYPHGTFVITFADEEAPINPVEPKKIALAEKYLSDTSFTKYREYFLWKLLWLYTKKDKIKHIKVAEELTKSNNLRVQIDSRRFLASYAYLDKDFSKAITLYDEAIKMDSTDSRERANFCLLIADCFFQIDKIDETMKYFRLIKEFEKDDKYKANTDMAERWENKNITIFERKAQGREAYLSDYKLTILEL